MPSAPPGTGTAGSRKVEPKRRRKAAPAYRRRLEARNEQQLSDIYAMPVTTYAEMEAQRTALENWKHRNSDLCKTYGAANNPPAETAPLKSSSPRPSRPRERRQQRHTARSTSSGDSGDSDSDGPGEAGHRQTRRGVR